MQKILEKLIEKGGKNETLFFKHLLKSYQKKTGKNLDSARSLYFLIKNTQSSSDFVIWNEKDTLYCPPIEKTSTISKNLKSVKIYPFNSPENKKRGYFAAFMHLISQTQESELNEALIAKTKNKDGTTRIVLDGSNFTLYTFNKVMDKYIVKNYMVSNPRFNDY